jgi:hypothetical protein
MDGPVVSAAEMALEMGNVNYILPYVKKEDEKELKYSFEKALSVRELSEDASELADYYFFETSVRLHRKGEGKSYDGIKPSGLNWGPVIRRAEKTIEEEDLTDFLEFMQATIEDELRERFDDVVEKKDYELSDVESAREYIESMLEFVLYSNRVYKFIIKEK